MDGTGDLQREFVFCNFITSTTDAFGDFTAFNNNSGDFHEARGTMTSEHSQQYTIVNTIHIG